MSKQQRPANWRDFEATGGFLGVIALLGIFAVAKQPAIDGFTAFLMALSATAIGTLVGLMFGLPRHLPVGQKQEEPNSADKKNSPPASGSQSTSNTFTTANTNLEEIADWLTKILLGAGLTQIGKVPGALESMAKKIEGTPATAINVAPIAISIWLFFIIFGFFLGYLMTRLFLAGAFSRAEANIDTATVTVAGKEYPLQKVMEAMDKNISDLQDHVVKQSSQSGQGAPLPPTITEKAKETDGLAVKTLLWVDEIPPLDQMVEKFKSLNIIVIPCVPSQAIEKMIAEAIDRFVFVLKNSTNGGNANESDFMTLISEAAGIAEPGSLVVYSNADDKARLEEQFHNIGASMTSSPTDLLALLRLTGKE